MEPRRRPGFPPLARPAWRAATLPARLLARWWVGFESWGEPIPEGPAVLAANHYSHVDPVLVGIAAARPIRYLAVDELFGRSPFFDRLTLWLGAIPMSRTRVPLGAMRTALAELDAGGTVGLFPEGFRVWAWGETAPKRGAAWLARRAGVPLVPLALAGSDQVMGRGAGRIERGPAVAVVCPAIAPAEHAAAADPVGEMTVEWERRVGDALEEAYLRLAGRSAR